MKYFLSLLVLSLPFIGAGCDTVQYNNTETNTLPQQEEISPTADWKLYEHESFTVSYPPDWKVDDITYSLDHVYFLPQEATLADNQVGDQVSLWVSPGGHGGPAACFSVAETESQVTFEGLSGKREECPGAITYLFTEKIDTSKQIEKGDAYFEIWFEFASGENDEEFIENFLSTLSIK